MGPSCPLAPAPGAGSVHSPLPHATLEPRPPWFPPWSGEPPRACTAAPACCWQPPHAGGGRVSTLVTPRMSKPRHRGRAGRPREWWGQNADPAGGSRDQAPPATHDPHGGAGRGAQGALLACEKGGRGMGKMNVWSAQWAWGATTAHRPSCKTGGQDWVADRPRSSGPKGGELSHPHPVPTLPAEPTPNESQTEQPCTREGAERAAGASAGLGRGAAEPRGAPACVRGGWALAGEQERGQSPAPGSGTEVLARRGPLHRPSVSRADAEGAGPRAAAAAFGLQQVHGPLRRPPGAEGEFSLLISHLITQDVW